MLALISLLLSLSSNGSLAKTTSQAHQCTGHVVNTSDQTPSVPYHEVVNMSVWFTSDYPPKPVIWCCITNGHCTNVTDHLIIHERSSTQPTIYETKLTVWSVRDDNWGRYTLSVCHHVIQNFTIYPLDDCDDYDPPNATKISSNYTGPVGLSHSIDCYFHGDTNTFDYDIKWIHKGKELKNDSHHIMETVKYHSCSFQKRLTIVSAITNDSGTYECYSQEQDGHANGTGLDVINNFLKYPEVLTTPNNQTLSQKDHLQLTWHVTGDSDSNNIYIEPVISINNKRLDSSLSQYTLEFIEDTVLPSKSYLVFNIDKVLDLQTNGEKTLNIQVYLKFQPLVSNVVDYNNNPNHSDITVITIKDNCILSWLIETVPGSITVLVVILIICVCCYCYCYKKKNSRRNGYEPIPGDDNENLHDVADSDEEEERNEEQENDTDNEDDINQGLLIVISGSETGNESDINHHDSYSSTLTRPEQASQHSSQPEEDQPGGGALVTSHLPSVHRYPNSRYDSLSVYSGATPYGSFHNRESSTRQTRSEDRSSSHLSSPRRTREHYTLDPAQNTNHLKPRTIIDDDDIEKDSPTSRRNLPFPTSKEVFILYCTNSFDQVCGFLQMLNYFSFKDIDSREQHYNCTVDFSYENHATVTNWSNWTERKIKDATHVLIICTPELHYHLSQTGSTVFETYRGPVSSNMVANLMTDQKHSSKFIPVFLNIRVNKSHVPAALLGKRCYELYIDQLIKNTMNDDGTQIYDGAVTEYLSNHDEMIDITDLITILRNH